MAWANLRMHKIAWTSVAERDLESISEFIAMSNPRNAIKIVQKIRSKVRMLKRLPLSGRKVPEMLFLGSTAYREIITPPWRIVYRVDQRNVYIMGVLDARRDVASILSQRLLNQPVSLN